MLRIHSMFMVVAITMIYTMTMMAMRIKMMLMAMDGTVSFIKVPRMIPHLRMHLFSSCSH